MKKLKYKVGDVVKITGTRNSIGVPDDVIGRKGKILKTDTSDVPYKIYLIGYSVLENDNDIATTYWLPENDIEKYRQEITPELLEQLPIGSIITTSEDKHNQYVKIDWNEFQNDNCDSLLAKELNDKLEFSETYGEPKLIGIQEPVYYTTFNQSDEPIEMTIEEISEELGYNIKIVKSK